MPRKGAFYPLIKSDPVNVPVLLDTFTAVAPLSPRLITESMMFWPPPLTLTAYTIDAPVAELPVSVNRLHVVALTPL